MAASKGCDMNAPRSRRTALFLSLCVLPGAGQWYLRERTRGGLFMAVSLVAACYPLLRFVRSMNAIGETLLSQPDPTPSLLWDAAGQAWALHGNWVFGGIALMLVCWVVAAGDLLRRRAYE
ncbi:MAG: hypothetical protein HY696_08090 [Deltaproteobacteria bacterium]|nr:hypothetical protein [Deltaproteobacteria bacterium]